MSLKKLNYFLFTSMFAVILSKNNVFAKEITIGNNSADILWENISSAETLIEDGDTVIILEPPADSSKSHPIYIKGNDVTIESRTNEAIKGASIEADGITEITLKNLKLYAPESEASLTILNEDDAVEFYEPNAKPQPTYPDPIPCTVNIEGNVFLTSGYEGSPSASESDINNYLTAQSTVFVRNVIFAGDGYLEVLGGNIGSDAQKGILAGYTEIKCRLKSTGGSGTGEYANGGEGIFCSGLDIHSDSNFYGGYPSAKGIYIGGHLTIQKNANVEAIGAASDDYGADGCYVKGFAKIMGNANFKGGDCEKGRAGYGLSVYHDELNVTGNLTAAGGNSKSDKETANPSYGGTGIWVNEGQTIFSGVTNATGGSSKAGLGGSGFVSLNKPINLYGTLNAAGGNGTGAGVVSFGAGVYFDNLDCSIMFLSPNAKIKITEGQNINPAYTGLSLKKGADTQKLNWKITKGQTKGNVGDSHIYVFGSNEVSFEGSGGQNVKPGGNPSSWAAKEMAEAIELGFVSDYLQGNYQTPITRLEFADLAASFLAMQYGYSPEDFLELNKTIKRKNPDGSDFVYKESTFLDTKDEFVDLLYSFGVVSGMSATVFAPELEISRQEASVMMEKAYLFYAKSIPGATSSPYADDNIIADWAKGSVYNLRKLNAMQGMGADTFDPLGNISREQAIAVFLRLYKTAPVSVKNSNVEPLVK